MVQVTIAVVYGIGQPATFAFQPLGGFSEELVATALVLVRHACLHHSSFNLTTNTQIIIALEEWSNGQLVSFRTLVTIANIISQRVQEMVHNLRSFKEGRPTAWRQFCQDVFIGAVSQVDSLAHQKPFTYLSKAMGDVYTVEVEPQSQLFVTE